MAIRKYEAPDQRNVRQEKLLFEFVSDICKYEHNAVYYLGASVLWGAYGKPGLLPSDITDKYAPLFAGNDQDLLPVSAIENFRNLLDCRLAEIKKEIETPDIPKTIHIYNKMTRQEEDIPERLFHPKLHERR